MVSEGLLYNEKQEFGATAQPTPRRPLFLPMGTPSSPSKTPLGLLALAEINDAVAHGISPPIPLFPPSPV